MAVDAAEILISLCSCVCVGAGPREDKCDHCNNLWCECDVFIGYQHGYIHNYLPQHLPQPQVGLLLFNIYHIFISRQLNEFSLNHLNLI